MGKVNQFVDDGIAQYYSDDAAKRLREGKTLSDTRQAIEDAILRTSADQQTARTGFVDGLTDAERRNYSVANAQLTPDRLVDPETADAGMLANRGGTMRTAPIKSRRTGARNRQAVYVISRKERLQYAAHAMLSTAALAQLHLDVNDPDKAEHALRRVVADVPKMLDDTFNFNTLH